MTFDLPKFIQRVEELINTEQGSVTTNINYGWDWELLRTAILTRDKVLEIEDSLKNSMSYFVENNIVSSLELEVDQLSTNTIEVLISSFVDDKVYNIKTEPIDLSTGEFSYVKLFPIQ